MKSTEHRTNKGQFTLGTDRYAYPLQSNLTKAIRMDTGVSVARCILIHTADRETDRQAAAYVLLPSWAAPPRWCRPPGTVEWMIRASWVSPVPQPSPSQPTRAGTREETPNNNHEQPSSSLACSLAEPPATKGCQLGGDRHPRTTRSHLPPGLHTTPRGSPTYALTRQYHSRTLIRPSLDTKAFSFSSAL